jgi:hypothetical protein
VVEDFDVVEVCCEIVVACVEPEVCDCVVSGLVFVERGQFSHAFSSEVYEYYSGNP